MTIPNETLAAIEEAGKRLKRLRTESHHEVYGRPGPGGAVDEERDRWELSEWADTLAAELRELRAKMERVGAIIGPIDCDIWDDGPFVRLRLTHPEARELAELLGGNPH